MIYTVVDPFYEEHPWLDDEESASAVYRRIYGSLTVFEFVHCRSHDGKIVPELDTRPRIHKLRTILAHVRKIDPRVRTPSSCVDRATFEQLDAMFVAGLAELAEEA